MTWEGSPTTFDLEILEEIFEIIEEQGQDVRFNTAGGVTIRVSPPIDHSESFIRRSDIATESLVLYVPAKNVTFDMIRGLEVVIDGEGIGRILEIEPIWGQETIVLYIVFLKLSG